MVNLEIDWSPGAAGEQSWAPIPALTTVSFQPTETILYPKDYDYTHPVILSFPNGQPGTVTIPATPLVLGVLLDQLPSSQIRTVEADDQLIVLLDTRRNVDSLRGEHVICFQNGLPIEYDRSKGIQSIKGKYGLGPLGDGISLKGGPIDPLCLSNPLHVKLVLADEGIRDEFVVEEVKVDVGGKLSHWKELAVGSVALFELPVLVDGNDLTSYHLEFLEVWRRWEWTGGIGEPRYL